MQILETARFNPATSFHDPHQLFCDGGLIGSNGNNKGGTWACRLVANGTVIVEDSGVVLPYDVRPCDVTNNLTEMLALLHGLEILPRDWRGTIWSDSKITLGRVFCGWHMSNIPKWMSDRLECQKAGLIHWNQIQYGLMDGHPTAAHLALGTGKRGHPVSVHNKAVDNLCKKQARAYLFSLGIK